MVRDTPMLTVGLLTFLPLMFPLTGLGAAAGRGGRSQAEASAGEGHSGVQDEEGGGGRHVAGRPEQQVEQGQKESSHVTAKHLKL